jgi:hypothetical protein
MNVRWIIQNNLISKIEFDILLEACKELDIEVEEIKVIPFSDDIPEFTQDERVNIYYGSTTLMYNIYHQMNNPTGLFFDDDAFSIENYMSKWGKHMLNSDAKITTFKEFAQTDYPMDQIFFIRPDDDSKSFAGTTMTSKQIKDWENNITLYDNSNLNKNTKIVIGEPYNIKKEWRTYVVDGKVATASKYRENFKLKTSGTDIPADMIQFVEDRCKEYQPYSAFAMDVALCGDSYYIIECGCINSVGLYKSDVKQLVTKLSEHVVSCK